MPKQNSLQRLGNNKIQAKQNHAFASVTYKIRCADFSVRTERGEVLRLSIIRLKLTQRVAQNMCSAHIFKVAYMCHTRLFADACDFPNCPLLWIYAFDSNTRHTPNRCITGV